MQHTLQPFDAVKCTPEQRKTILVLGRKIGMEIYKDGFWDTDQWPFIVADQNTLHGCSSAYGGANWLSFDEFVSRMNGEEARQETRVSGDGFSERDMVTRCAIMPLVEMGNTLNKLLDHRAEAAKRYLYYSYLKHPVSQDDMTKCLEVIEEYNEQIKLFLAIP